ncbi:MAG: hypothetical protein ACXABF_14420 [Candidatus Thorarchaeota archaeon]
MIMHDHRCKECGSVTEALVQASVRSVSCQLCGGHATRVILKAPNPDWTGLAMGDTASPEAINRFERSRKQQRDKEEKSLRENGDYGAAPGSDGGSSYS